MSLISPPSTVSPLITIETGVTGGCESEDPPWLEEWYDDGEYFSEVPLQYADASLRGDKELVLLALATEERRDFSCLDDLPGSFRFASAELRRDKDVIMAAVAHQPDVLGSLDGEAAALLTDTEFALAAVKIHPAALEHFTIAVRGNRDFVMQAMDLHWTALPYASDALRANRDVVLKAIRAAETRTYDGYSEDRYRPVKGLLHYTTEALRDDKEVVMEAIRCNVYGRGNDIDVGGNEFEDVASPALRQDPEVATAYISNYGDYSCRYSGFNCRNLSAEQHRDREIMLAAIKVSPHSFPYSDDTLKSDRAFVENLLEESKHMICVSIFEHVALSLRADKELMLKAVTKHISLLQLASEGLRGDATVVTAAVHKDPRSIEFASQEMKDNKEVVMSMFTQKKKNAWNGASVHSVLQHISDRLKADADVMHAAITGTISPLGHRGCYSTIEEVFKSAGSAGASDVILKDAGFILRCCQTVSDNLSTALRKAHASAASDAQNARNNSHTLPTDLWKGRVDNTSTNVMLVSADGTRLPAHREILALRSPVFRAMFSSGFAEGDSSSDAGHEVKIPNVETAVLEELLHYIYTDTLRDRAMEELCVELFELSCMYELPGLQEATRKAVVEGLSEENALSLLVLADRHSAEPLGNRAMKESVIKYICEHWGAIMDGDGDTALKDNVPLFKELNSCCARFLVGQQRVLKRQRGE